jgi:Domain of unknown function (DUF4365)
MRLGNYQQERRGVSAVQAYAAERGQIWRETITGDVGIDGQLEFVNSKGNATGQTLAAQIKCGPSYFANPTENGWKFHIDEKHQEYWERYPLPVLIVLHDPIKSLSYWMDVRQALRNPSTSEKFVVIPEANILQKTDAIGLFKTAGARPEEFLHDIQDVFDHLLKAKNKNGSFPISYLDLFAGGLTNICRSLYFGMDVAINAVEANIALAGSEFGYGMGAQEYEFIFDYVRFLVAQNIADVDFSDCLIDWADREMVPHFVAPLTSRGRALVEALQTMEKSLVMSGTMSDGGGLLVAQEGFFGMKLESYYRRLPRIFEFQDSLRKQGK